MLIWTVGVVVAVVVLVAVRKLAKWLDARDVKAGRVDKGGEGFGPSSGTSVKPLLW